MHESFGSCVAQVAEVSVEDTPTGPAVRVHRVVCAVDCGIAVNPETIRAQMESGIAFGLGAALHSKLSFKEGRVQQSNFHDYQVLRLNEMPQVEVHIVPSTEKPGGIGETGVPPIAPAVANAVFALTGQRLRELPLQLARHAPARPEETAMRIARRRYVGRFAPACCRGAARSRCGACGERVSPEQEQAAVAAFATVAEGVPASALQQLPHSRRPAVAVRPQGCRMRWACVRGPRAMARAGLPCSTCHGEKNLPASYGPHAPPGAPHWGLPPPDMKMAWIGLPRGAAVRDDQGHEAQRRPRLRRAASSTSREDKLVLWGWDPGGNRAPVPVPHDQFVAAFKTWVEMAGLPGLARRFDRFCNRLRAGSLRQRHPGIVTVADHNKQRPRPPSGTFSRKAGEGFQVV